MKNKVIRINTDNVHLENKKNCANNYRSGVVYRQLTCILQMMNESGQ